jgi:quercetin dioxygenase-like cupin family protein
MLERTRPHDAARANRPEEPMIRYRLKNLNDVRDTHFLEGLVPGRYIYVGGMGFKGPGDVTHPGRHTHDDAEVFIVLQGKGELEIEGTRHPIATGDILVVEPGEDHHLVSSEDDPLVNIWLHCGPKHHTEVEGSP